MKKTYFSIIVISLFFVGNTNAQYSPPAGYEGSVAIHCDSSIIERWAISCIIKRGWMDCSDTSLGRVTFGIPENALSKADNSVISLGDGGVAIMSFSEPISNRQGYDFAIFENSFSDDFLELAFVEVSTDSLRWVRFPAVSLTQDTEQIGTFGNIDTRQINNLAGKFRAGFGTPFDLVEVRDSLGIDINNIRFIKIIDVFGSLHDCTSFDSNGRAINEPWPTPFNTGGFDLDAVAVLKPTLQSCINKLDDTYFNSFLKSDGDLLVVNTNAAYYSISIFNLIGGLVFNGENVQTIPVSDFIKGIYILRFCSEKRMVTQKLFIGR